MGPLEPGAVNVDLAIAAHPTTEEMHLGWRIGVGTLGPLECPKCSEAFVLAGTSVSKVLGRDISWESFRALVEKMDKTLQAHKLDALPMDFHFREGPVWLWYTMVYPYEGEPAAGFWLGFGDGGFPVHRMQLEAWLVDARAWETKVLVEGWESLRTPQAEPTAETPPPEDETLRWLRGQMGE